MGGAFDYRGNTTPVAEWNISVDPEAAAEVFNVWGAAWGLEMPTHLPIVLGLNLTEHAAMTPAILSRLAAAAGSATAPMSVLDDRGTLSAATNPLIRVLEDAMRFYFEFHFDQGEGYLAHLHDPLAAAVALDPDMVRCRQTTIDVELAGRLTRAMTVVDWRGHWGRQPNAHVGVGVDPSMNSFGGMINLARSEMSRDPVVWWSFAAAFCFMVAVVLAANLLADGVRDAFDPRARVFRPRLVPLRRAAPTPVGAETPALRD